MASEAPYAALSGLFVAGLLAAAKRAGRDRGAGPTTATDIAALGLAAAKVGKVVAEDRVTVFLRRPFADGPAAVQPRGEGLARAIGELVTCPHCVSLWAAGILGAAQVAQPRAARFVTRVLAAYAVADAVAPRLRARD